MKVRLKRLVLSTLLVLAGSSYAHASSFMPENFLWMEDHFTQGNVDEETFELIIEVGRTLYQRHAKRRKETLTIVGNWNNSTVNAYMSRHNGKVNITMFGGLARRPEINAEGFALVLCHELSHAYGGAPYIYKEERISAEGQADYAGARVCMRRMASALDFPFRYDTYITRICAGDFLCEVSLSAGQSTANLLARLSTEGTPSYQTPDRTRVTKTNLSYPKTVQCRLDSYFNGTMNKPRPRCWYYN